MTSTMTSRDLLEDLLEAQDELPQAARNAAGSPVLHSRFVMQRLDEQMRFPSSR